MCVVVVHVSCHIDTSNKRPVQYNARPRHRSPRTELHPKKTSFCAPPPSPPPITLHMHKCYSYSLATTATQTYKHTNTRIERKTAKKYTLRHSYNWLFAGLSLIKTEKKEIKTPQILFRFICTQRVLCMPECTDKWRKRLGVDISNRPDAKHRR